MTTPSSHRQQIIDLASKLTFSFPELTIGEALAAAEAIIALRSNPPFPESTQQLDKPK